MKPTSFSALAAVLKDRSGLVLSEGKGYLVDSRLMPIVRKRGFQDLDDLVAKLPMDKDGLVKEVTDAMTTNESLFFRDMRPFDLFRNEILPAKLKARAATRRLRIWCAACSTGQEPYSLAMILQEEAAKLQGWTIDILGTDLSTEVIERAREGVYSQFEVQRGLPIQFLVKYFTQIDDTSWRINDSLRPMITYKEYNLLDDLTALGSFDIVFCRNVLIYFDTDTKRQVLDSIANLLPPDGVLYLGGAETVIGITERFKPLEGQRGVYGLVPQSQGAAVSRIAV
jgi:chemotaxis protein methyltransferase CheR